MRWVLMRWALWILLVLAPAAGRAEDPLYTPLPDPKVLARMALSDHPLSFSLFNRDILFTWGKVDSGSSDRFRDALRPGIKEVWLFSPGGSLQDGLEIGRIIRAHRIVTRVPNGARCISACNFMFMGGVLRYVGASATIEVHMFSDMMVEKLMDHLRRLPTTSTELVEMYPNFLAGQAESLAGIREMLEKDHPNERISEQQVLDELLMLMLIDDYTGRDNSRIPQDPAEKAKFLEKLGKEEMPHYIQRLALGEDVKDIQQDSAQVAATIAGYLVEMSVSLRFLTRFANIPNDVPRPLTREEMRSLNIVNVDR
jgi:hypothetical protein